MPKNMCVEKKKYVIGLNNYSQFIHSFTNFITNYFETYTFEIQLEKEQLLGERQMTQSLLLLEKLHMYLFLSFSNFKKYIKLPNNTHPFISDSNYEFLKILQSFIDQYTFLTEENEIFCRKIVSQILSYYPQNSYNIKIILSPLPQPWIANI